MNRNYRPVRPRHIFIMNDTYSCEPPHRTFHRVRSNLRSACRTVVLPDPAVGKIRKVRLANPDRDRKEPCV
jgi:hypothetical protein